jgi:hypothetical protein
MNQPLKKLCVGVSFHYNANRLGFLKQTLSNLPALADEVEVHVFTNASEDSLKDTIRAAGSSIAPGCLAIHEPKLLGHPFLLTWCHMNIFRARFHEDSGISHFMYLEDDIDIREHNVRYWLDAREALRPHGLIPSFLRYEYQDGCEEKCATDIVKMLVYTRLRKIDLSTETAYVNLPNPYQGMYLLDRALMKEHLDGPSSAPEFGSWGIREKAAAGITFLNVPAPFHSRNLVGYNKTIGQVDPGCLIHHIPNNYANNPASGFGKVRVSELIQRHYNWRYACHEWQRFQQRRARN